MTWYGNQFFESHQSGSYASALRVVPIVLSYLTPSSVIDVGCGTGTWLAAFSELGIGDVTGVDGEYVDRKLLQISKDRFLPFDLETPFRLSRTFDLAMSLEVAEHLSADKAESFVDSLTRLAPVLLFSAAIPYQGGAHHVNERWPEYWADLFSRQGYTVLDPIRPQIWADPSVEWWYAQNIVLFVRRSDLNRYPALQAEHLRNPNPTLSVVHPRKYLSVIAPEERMMQATNDIKKWVPDGNALVLADEDQWSSGGEVAGRRAVPLVEREGKYWGVPADDAQAVTELQKHLGAGLRYVVFGWPAFWWLDHYKALPEFLRRHARCLLRNDRVVIFAVH